MAQSLAKILVHAIFSTHQRKPLLHDPLIRAETYRYMGGILTRLECQPIVIGGVEDHAHLLFALSRTCEAAKVVAEVKRGSSVWLKSKFSECNDFSWQHGYGIFSIGSSQIDSTRAYIQQQEEHHRKVSFQNEFRQFLKRYEVAFDERYVWD
jgi:REP element-mobilizing transposase RayT